MECRSSWARSSGASDHLIMPALRTSGYPGRADGQPPDGWKRGLLPALQRPQLLAGRTRRVRLGTSVLILPMRNPVQVAAQVGGGPGHALPPQREDCARPAEPLELVVAARVQNQARTVEEIARCAGDENLAWTGEGRHPCRCVNADAARLPADDLDLGCVEPDAGSDAELRDGGIHECPGTNRLRGTVEEREKAVPGGGDLPASEAIDRRAEPHVVLPKHIGPRVIAEALEHCGRAIPGGIS